MIKEEDLSGHQKAELWTKIKNLHRLDNRERLDLEYEFIRHRLANQ